MLLLFVALVVWCLLLFGADETVRRRCRYCYLLVNVVVRCLLFVVGCCHWCRCCVMFVVFRAVAFCCCCLVRLLFVAGSCCNS